MRVKVENERGEGQGKEEEGGKKQELMQWNRIVF